MTLEFFKDYQELFNGCVWYSDGSLGTSNELLNIMNSSLNAPMTGSITRTGNDRFGRQNMTLNNFAAGRYFTMPQSIFTDNSNLTILVWVKYPATISVQSQILGPLTQTGGNGGIWLHMYSTGTIMEFYDFRVNPTPYLGCNIVNDAGWHMWTVQTNKSTGAACKLWIDGLYKVSGSTFAAGGNAYTMCLGNNVPRTDYYYKDAIGEMLIFNRLITDIEIKEFYDLTKTKYLYPVLPGQRSVE